MIRESSVEPTSERVIQTPANGVLRTCGAKVTEKATPSMRPVQTSGTARLLRLWAKALMAAAILLMTPIALLLTPREDRTGILIVTAVASVILVAGITRDVLALRETRRAREADDSRPPSLERVWDESLRDDGPWSPSAALSDLARPLLEPGRHATVREGPSIGRSLLVRRTGATLVTAGPGPLRHAIESAAAATGLASVPSVWSAPTEATNAFVIEGSDGFGIVFGQRMLADFAAEEITAVAVNLLSRWEDGIPDDFGFARPRKNAAITDRYQAALRAYFARDRRTVLAMRDPAPLVSALRKTEAAADPWIPGITVDDALSTWTWPGPPIADPPDDWADMVALFGRALTADGIGTAPRAETVRIALIEDLTAPRTD